MTKLDKQVIEYLIGAAQEDVDHMIEDNYNPEDHAGGNFDDCFYNGTELGETMLARKVLQILDVKWWRGEDNG